METVISEEARKFIKHFTNIGYPFAERTERAVLMAQILGYVVCKFKSIPDPVFQNDLETIRDFFHKVIDTTTTLTIMTSGFKEQIDQKLSMNGSMYLFRSHTMSSANHGFEYYVKLTKSNDEYYVDFYVPHFLSGGCAGGFGVPDTWSPVSIRKDKWFFVSSNRGDDYHDGLIKICFSIFINSDEFTKKLLMNELEKDYNAHDIKYVLEKETIISNSTKHIGVIVVPPLQIKDTGIDEVKKILEKLGLAPATTQDMRIFCENLSSTDLKVLRKHHYNYMICEKGESYTLDAWNLKVQEYRAIVESTSSIWRKPIEHGFGICYIRA
jgi:hypothetical protein